MRKTSDVRDTTFPFTADTTAFILVVTEHEGDHRGFEHASTFEKKRALVEHAIRREEDGYGSTLLAVWPGKTRSDVFHVDNLEEALHAFA
jgi:hypothetical protein